MQNYYKSAKLDNVCYEIRGVVLREARRLEEEVCCAPAPAPLSLLSDYTDGPADPLLEPLTRLARA